MIVEHWLKVTTQFLETQQLRVLKYPFLWKEAVVRVGRLNSTPTLFGNHAIKLWSFVPSGHTSQLHLTVLRPRRKTFPNKQGTPGVWLQKEGRLFHTVSSGTGTEPHSASAWLPRETSATKIKTYQTRKVYFKDFIFVFRPSSWSSGQGFWLLIMRSRVRFPVLPWEFFFAGKDCRGDHGLGS